MGEQGKVVLRILVNEKGLPDQVHVQTSSGFARLDEAGRQAALRALFKPYMEDGRPVAVFVIVPLNFTLAS
jgi:protein TonB